MTNIKDEIEKITNEDIRDKILTLNDNQLKLIRDASYFIGFNQMLDLREHLNEIKSTGERITRGESELFDKLFDKIIYGFACAINPQLSNEKLELDELMKIRQEIVDLSSIIAGYQIELSYVGEMVDEHGIKLLCEQDYKSSQYNSKRVEELIDYIMITLENAKNDYNKYMGIVSEITLILPMRLVKNNYFDILKKSIMRNLKSSTKLEIESKIEGYKKQFDSSIRDGYGTMFDYYFTEVHKLRNVDLTGKKIEDLDNIVKDIMELTEEISELYNFLFGLGLVVNKIIVINLLQDISVTEEVEGLYNAWIKALEHNEGVENFKEKIERKIEDIEKGIFSSLDEFNELNKEALIRKNFDYDELSKELLHTRKVLTIYNDINLADINEAIAQGDELATYEYLEQKCESLTQYINRSLIGMNNMERKIRMRRLLSLVELPFAGMEEFMDYIRYSLDNRVLSNAEINFKIDYILYFLEEVTNS